MLPRTIRGFLITFLFLSVPKVKAQVLISAGGNTLSGSACIVEFAIGEPCISTIEQSNFIFTQGLLQPILSLAPTPLPLSGLIIPNTFSPNGDGINDLWVIKALETKNCRLEIFNRYGQKLYSWKGYFKGWNGTYNGLAVPIGTYYYILNVEGLSHTYSGWLLLIR